MVTGRRVLVCGGRNFNDVQFVFHTLSRLNEVEPIERIIHGGASGADRLAGMWAALRAVPVDVFPADWSRHGRAAGRSGTRPCCASGGRTSSSRSRVGVGRPTWCAVPSSPV
jgi:hypothetical protein